MRTYLPIVVWTGRRRLWASLSRALGLAVALAVVASIALGALLQLGAFL